MANSTQALRDSLPDHASDHDSRGIAIDRVGIRDLSYPIVVLDKQHKRQSTIAKVSASVGLPEDQRGTHMSRFVEVLNSVRGEITVRNLPGILKRMQERLETDRVQVDFEFPYFIEKKAPASGAESLMKYDCAFLATAEGAAVDFVLKVVVPVTTLCPCSKAISKYGAHNQRGLITLQMRSPGFAWIEDVVEVIESCASAPLYPLLKREDEKAVTELAYENPRFVEDLIREVCARVRDELGASWLEVSVENAESIHDHAAFAELTWPSANSTPASTGEVETSHSTPIVEELGAESFGAWLADRRTSRGHSQAEFARRIELSASHLSRLERDEKRPSEALATSIAEALGDDPRAVRLRAGYLDLETAAVLAQRLPEIDRWMSAQP